VVIRITVWIQGLFSGFITIGKYRKWLVDINLLLILIRQMVALVRRALAEVYTDPVLLVLSVDAHAGGRFYISHFLFTVCFPPFPQIDII